MKGTGIDRQKVNGQQVRLLLCSLPVDSLLGREQSCPSSFSPALLFSQHLSRARKTEPARTKLTIPPEQKADLPLISQPCVWCVFLTPQWNKKGPSLPEPRDGDSCRGQRDSRNIVGSHCLPHPPRILSPTTIQPWAPKACPVSRDVKPAKDTGLHSSPLDPDHHVGIEIVDSLLQREQTSPSLPALRLACVLNTSVEQERSSPARPKRRRTPADGKRHSRNIVGSPGCHILPGP
ncbi:uncharacterized protein LOC129633903 [Bubalus kerabau]|uniref:uncharacterized protein LOC129633903 n=1 Tax=Bubalus carabanensis TaxID=3119969 RepID=UPI00244EF79A|nr:uncharacterized protein LOC129633903 [Bubalus carabanensis]